MFTQMFNRYASANQNLIQKALTTATNVGGALIPENLEQIITDTVQRLSPEISVIEAKDTGGAKTHEFNRITQLPKRGGAMGESATTPATNSKSQRATVDLKIVRRKGKVTNFLQDASRKYIDTASWELQNHLRQHVNDLIYYMLYGNADSNAYEFDGIQKFISTNKVNEAKGGAVPTDLSFLDDMIDASNSKGGSPHRRVFGMSPQMLSKVSRLLTNVRLNQGLTSGGLTQVEINGGWRLMAYRDIPIIETTALRPIETMSPTITYASGGTTGGSLSDDTYYFQIAPVTYEGEQLAKSEQSVTLSGGTATQRIKIDFDAVHKNASSVENAIAYRIYASTTSGSEVLIKQVSAFTYDSEGTISGDNGVDSSIYVDTLTPASDIPAHMQLYVPLVATGGVSPESCYLWDLDPIQGLGKVPYTNTAGSEYKGLVTTEPLAKVDDYIQFLVKSYLSIANSFETTSFWHRGLRVE